MPTTLIITEIPTEQKKNKSNLHVIHCFFSHGSAPLKTPAALGKKKINRESCRCKKVQSDKYSLPPLYFTAGGCLVVAFYYNVEKCPLSLSHSCALVGEGCEFRWSFFCGFVFEAPGVLSLSTPATHPALIRVCDALGVIFIQVRARSTSSGGGFNLNVCWKFNLGNFNASARGVVKNKKKKKNTRVKLLRSWRGGEMSTTLFSSFIFCLVSFIHLFSIAIVKKLSKKCFSYLQAV